MPIRAATNFICFNKQNKNHRHWSLDRRGSGGLEQLAALLAAAVLLSWDREGGRIPLPVAP